MVQKRGENQRLLSSNLVILSFFALILINLPVAASFEISQADITAQVVDSPAPLTQQNPPLPNPANLSLGEKCSEKSDKTSGFVEFMDNGVIKVLEDIASVLFMITTVMGAIDTVIHTVHVTLLCCSPSGISNPACYTQEAKIQWWENIYSFVRPLACFVNCGWCGGIDGKSSSSCWTLGIDQLPTLGDLPNFAYTGPKNSAEKPTASGLGQFHISPYDNIYTAIGCICPIAILFNLRKLKTIYQVHDCCVQEACKNGMSTDSCDKQLSEATCMYWQGSLLKMFAKVIASIISSWISDIIISQLKNVIPGLACAVSIFDLVQVPSEIQAVRGAWDWMTRSFKEPSCSDLGFKDAKRQLESGLLSQASGINTLTLNDKNGDGRYDTIRRNYNVKKMSAEEMVAATGKDEDSFKKGEWERVTGTNSNGEIFTYYRQSDGIFSSYTYFDSDLSPLDRKSAESAMSNAVVQLSQGAFARQGNIVQLGDEFYYYSLVGDGVQLTSYDSSGEPVTVTRSLSELAGTDFVLAGENLKDYQWDSEQRAFTSGEKILDYDGTDSSGNSIFLFEDAGVTSTIYQFKDGSLARRNGEKVVYDVNGLSYEFTNLDSGTPEQLESVRQVLYSEDSLGNLEGATGLTPFLTGLGANDYGIVYNLPDGRRVYAASQGYREEQFTVDGNTIAITKTPTYPGQVIYSQGDSYAAIPESLAEEIGDSVSEVRAESGATEVMGYAGNAVRVYSDGKIEFVKYESVGNYNVERTVITTQIEGGVRVTDTNTATGVSTRTDIYGSGGDKVTVLESGGQLTFTVGELSQTISKEEALGIFYATTPHEVGLAWKALGGDLSELGYDSDTGIFYSGDLQGEYRTFVLKTVAGSPTAIISTFSVTASGDPTKISEVYSSTLPTGEKVIMTTEYGLGGDRISTTTINGVISKRSGRVQETDFNINLKDGKTDSITIALSASESYALTYSSSSSLWISDKTISVGITSQKVSFDDYGNLYLTSDGGQTWDRLAQTQFSTNPELIQLEQSAQAVFEQKQQAESQVQEQKRKDNPASTPKVDLELKKNLAAQAQIIHSLTWKLLNTLLEEFAYPQIDKICQR